MDQQVVNWLIEVLTVHHLDSNKWNLLPWNLAALCQRCHYQVQWTLDFRQSTLTDIYPQRTRAHVRAYNAWAHTKGRTRLVLAERDKDEGSSAGRFTGKSGVLPG